MGLISTDLITRKGGAVEQTGEFLFGSDPEDTGAEARNILTQFGLGGGELAAGLRKEGTILSQILGARGRQARGQQLARSGLTGSGIAEDVLGDVGLQEADFLRKFQSQMIRERIRALGIASGGPVIPGSEGVAGDLLGIGAATLFDGNEK